MRRYAFTLAEVLITLGIIGVVAAMTIPTLMNKTNDAELKTAWKKQFSVLSQNSEALVNEESTLKGLFTGPDDFRDKFTAKMNVIKKCDAGTPQADSNCWAGHWYKVGGAEFTDYDVSGLSRVVLSDGAYLGFTLGDKDCNWGALIPGGNNCGQLYVDVNGAKKPNTIGKDIFSAMINSSGKIFPVGTDGDWSMFGGNLGNVCDPSINAVTTGWRCSADYLYK